MSIKFLRGKRFDGRANDHFIMAESYFLSIDWISDKWIEQLKRYVEQHKLQQLPRLQELKRYYLGDNNIKYREDKSDPYAADNRIASDFAKYITIFEQGYMLGKPVTYKNENEVIEEQIVVFGKKNNEEYHNVQIKTDLSIYGRAYELLTSQRESEKSTVQVKLYRLNPEQTFVIYDDTYEHNSLMAVNYYSIDYGDGIRKTVIKVYTGKTIYVYEDDNQNTDGMVFISDEDHFFNGVPINEFSNNEDRVGAYESVLDNIDAYDLSQSELANFQQNSNDAMLVIKGNPYTGTDENDYFEDGRINPNGRLGVSLGFKKAQIIILDDNPNENGSDPDAYYLKKEYDAAGAEAYKKRLVSDILRFTFTPDTNDEHFGGTQSGESMKYKMMGSDNYRAKQERLFKKGLMRRLRLAVNIWRIKGNASVNYEAINETSILFTPNMPQNRESLIASARNLYGIVSDETLFEILQEITGINANEEMDRLRGESEEKSEPRIQQVGDADGEA